MPSGTCKGCGRITNSTTSNWWFTKDFQPTECYMAWEGDRKVKGCGFDKAEPWVKKWIEKMIKDQDKPEEPFKFEEGE